MARFAAIGMLIFLGAHLTTALEPADNYREGSCSGIRAKLLRNLNRPLLDSMIYMVGGSRYHLYRAAAADPQYRTIREDEFYYDSCIQATRNSVSTLEAQLSVFSRTTVEMDLRVRPDRPDIYFEAVSRNPLAQWDFSRAQVTLTDNKSFAFILNCWPGVDQRAWNVISNLPSLDEKTVRLIEDHATTLGFDKQHFVFLRQDKCRRANPLLTYEKEYRGGSHQVEGRNVQLTRVSLGPREGSHLAGIIDGDDFVARRLGAGYNKKRF